MHLEHEGGAVFLGPHDLKAGISNDVVLSVRVDLGEDGAHTSRLAVISYAGIHDEAELLVLARVPYYRGGTQVALEFV
jgi:hypothetical protein